TTLPRWSCAGPSTSGATARWLRSVSETTAREATATHCPYCALQCAMTLMTTPDGVRVEGREFPTNRGGLCRKGWTAAELLDRPDRLGTPLLRTEDGTFEPVG